MTTEAPPGTSAPLRGQDERWMARALDLAERGRHSVSPNPLVGCVLVRDGRVVGEGWHERAGGPHAEVVALEAAGPAARGATAYVTLEPCDHHGRTPPCSASLVAAGVDRVVAATGDPHPVAGGGAARLTDAGVAVTVGLMEEAAARQNEVFLHGVATARPFVVAKAAVSLDGRIAAADGTAMWLTGAQARLRGHELRAAADAVMAGSGTVLADHPRLTCRLPGYAGAQPLRVVLDRRARTTEGLCVYDDSAPTVRVVTAGRPRIAGVDQLTVEGAAPDGGLGEVLAALWGRGVRSVLVEGGSGVVTSALAAGLVDKLVVHVAPLLLGSSGRAAVGDLGVKSLDDARRWHLEAADRAGDDVILTLYPEG